MKMRFAILMSLTLPLLALPAAAQETTLLCRFAKFTVTESGPSPARIRTVREVTLAIPRSILVAYDAANGEVVSPQKNMQFADAKYSDDHLSTHIQHASDTSWLFGEETTGSPVLIVDAKSHIGSIMAQLKSDGLNKMALSSGDCRQFRMQS